MEDQHSFGPASSRETPIIIVTDSPSPSPSAFSSPSPSSQNSTELTTTDFKEYSKFALEYGLYLFWFSTIIGILINLCVMVAIVACRKYRRPTNSLLAFLALASIFSTLWTALKPMEGLKGKSWFEIPYFCQFTTFMRRLPQPIMSFTTVTIVLDRKRFVRNPLARPTWAKYGRQIMIIFLAAIVLAGPRFFEREYHPREDQSSPLSGKCKKVLIGGNEWLTISYNLANLLCTYFIPTAILVKEIWLSKSIIHCLFSTTDRHFILDDKRAQLVITICLFACGFITCWPQHGLFYFMANLPTELLGPSWTLTTEHWWYYSRTLFFAYTSINPCLLFVLCYDWQWTTIIQLMRNRRK